MDAPEVTNAAPRGYHHGDLRRALIEAALSAVQDDGAANVSLRDVARRAGVSHAAPAHHFGDKAGLLTAIAADGFDLLAAALTDAYDRTASFLEVGVAYVRFAVDHRAHFEVMFRPELYRADDPALVGPKAAAAAALHGPLGDVVHDDDPLDRLTPFVAVWSLVHGLATLLLTENLPDRLGLDPEQITRRVAGYLVPASATSRPPASAAAPTASDGGGDHAHLPGNR